MKNIWCKKGYCQIYLKCIFFVKQRCNRKMYLILRYIFWHHIFIFIIFVKQLAVQLKKKIGELDHKIKWPKKRLNKVNVIFIKNLCKTIGRASKGKNLFHNFKFIFFRHMIITVFSTIIYIYHFCKLKTLAVFIKYKYFNLTKNMMSKLLFCKTVVRSSTNICTFLHDKI